METIPKGTKVRIRRYRLDRTRMLVLEKDARVKANGYVSLSGMRARQSDGALLYWTSYYVPREYVEVVS